MKFSFQAGKTFMDFALLVGMFCREWKVWNVMRQFNDLPLQQPVPAKASHLKLCYNKVTDSFDSFDSLLWLV